MPRWLRRRRSARARSAAADQPASDQSPGGREPERGPKILLECHDGDAEGTGILAALSERYEITALGTDSRRFRVVVDDAVFADEAVVRLASVLDEIDQDWVWHLRWPKTQA